MFALWIAVMLNNEVHESIPAVFDTFEECSNYEQQYKEIVMESQCYYIDPSLIKIKK